MKSNRKVCTAVFGFILALMITVLPNIKVSAAAVSYVDATVTDGTVTYTDESITDGEYSSVTSGVNAWGSAGETKWYVVDSNVTIESRITVLGDVRLILCDGCTLTAPKGITVTGEGNKFTVYAGGTSDNISGTGMLTIENVEYYNAGIGGEKEQEGSNITINGGTVTATGGECGAGIGGGCDGAGSNITINGGTVTVTGGECGAGIGGGRRGSGSHITVDDGTVIATGGQGGGTTGGYGGAGIGGGDIGAGSYITVYGGRVEAKGGIGAAGIGGGAAKTGCNIKIAGGTVKATGVQYGAGIGGGTDHDGSNITITAGTVTAKGGENGGAGIGGGMNGGGGNITITAGIITATGGENGGAGIGGGTSGTGSGITINGGTVTATGTDSGAGIGGGMRGAGSSITITGGTVTATGGEAQGTYNYSNGAAIGNGGYNTNSGGTTNGTDISIGAGCAVWAKTGTSDSYTLISDGSLAMNGNGLKSSEGDGKLSYQVVCVVGLFTPAAEGFVSVRSADNEVLFGTLSTDPDIVYGDFNIYSDEACANCITDSGLSFRLDSSTGQVYVSSDENAGIGSCYAGVNVSYGGSNFILKIGRIVYINSDKLLYKSPKCNNEGNIIIDSVTGEPQFENLSLSAALNNTNVDVLVLRDSDTTWGTEGKTTWCIADGPVNIYARVTVAGDVRLILRDDCELNVPKGITVTGDNSFTVYSGGALGNISGSGKLTINAVDDYNAGIGGENGQAGNNIKINGGTVTVIGGTDGAGIGGGDRGVGSNITMNGGTVTATGGNCGAGIGGGRDGSGSNITINGGGRDGSGSNITINGGKVEATGGNCGAGIGGGDGGAGSNITINGGTVTANGGDYGAGIGGGDGGAGSNITINGGTVTATGGENGGAGIGGGNCGAGSNITINGGTVTATGGKNGAGIGGGCGGSGSNITINGGTVIAIGGTCDEYTYTSVEYIFKGAAIGNGGYNNTFTSGTTNGTDICIKSGQSIFSKTDASESYTLLSDGSGDTTQEGLKSEEEGGKLSYQFVLIIDLNNFSFKRPLYDEDGTIVFDATTEEPQFENVLFSDLMGTDDDFLWLAGTETEWGTEGKTTWCVAAGTVDYTSVGRVTVKGEVRLILCDGCVLNVPKGITVSGEGNSFTVYAGGTTDDVSGSGKLTITSVDDENAGIGGGNQGAGSNITINGGTVTAIGGENASGIGDGRNSGCVITITGGTVTATGGSDGAGIGGGYGGHGSNITINGGTIIANGGNGGAGIGCGKLGSTSYITITGGTVTATGGNDGAGIGGGGGGDGNNITITAGTVTAIGGARGGAGIGGGKKGSTSDITITAGIITATGGEGGAGIGGGKGGAGSNISIKNCIVKAGSSAADSSAVLKQTVTETDIGSMQYVFATKNLFTSSNESISFTADIANGDVLLGTVSANSMNRCTFGIYSNKACINSVSSSGINVRTDITTGKVYVSSNATASRGTYYIGVTVSDGSSSLTVKVGRVDVVKRLSAADFTVTGGSYTYNGSTQKPAITCVESTANVSYVFVNAATNKVVSSPVNAGTYRIYAAVTEENLYEGNAITYGADGVTYVSGGIDLGSFTIGRYTPQAADYQVSGTSVDYDGSAHQATVVRASLIQGIADEVYYVSKSGSGTELSSITEAGTYEIRVRIQDNGNFGQVDLLIGEMTVTQQSNPNPDGGQGGGNQGGSQGGNQGGNQGGSQGGNQGGSQGGNQGGSQGGNQGGNQGGSQGGNQGGSQGGNQGGSQGGNSGNNDGKSGSDNKSDGKSGNDDKSDDSGKSGSDDLSNDKSEDGKPNDKSEDGKSNDKSEDGKSGGKSDGKSDDKSKDDKSDDSKDGKSDEPEYQSCSTISKTLGIGRPFDLGFSLIKGCTLVCTSSRPKVASVSEDGVITGLKAGKATITCTVMKGDKEVFTSVISVKVKDGYKNGKAKASLKKTSKKYPIMNVYKLTKVGKTFDLSVENLPEGWTVSYSSASSKTVKVDKSGTATAKKKGWVSVTTTVKDENGKIVYKINSIVKVK